MAVLAKGSHLGVEDLPAELERSPAFDRSLPVTYSEDFSRGGASSDPLLAHTLMRMARDLNEVLRRLEALEERLGGLGGRGAPHPWASGAPVAEVMPLGMEGSGDLESAEKAMIQAALRSNGGNRRRAAEQLGISERTLYRKLRRYGLGI
jgi:DNA-binding NtrC family response regulator